MTNRLPPHVIIWREGLHYKPEVRERYVAPRSRALLVKRSTIITSKFRSYTLSNIQAHVPLDYKFI